MSIVADEAVNVVTGGSSAVKVTVRDSSFTSTTLSSITSRLPHTTAPADCPPTNVS